MMTAQARTLPLLFIFLLIGAVAVWAAGDARPALAQTPTRLADFDDAGLDVDMAAVITAGNDSVWWFPASSLGTLLEGELGIGPDNVVPSAITSSANGSQITIRHSDSSFSMSTHFGSGGDGENAYFFLEMGGTSVNWRIADNLHTNLSASALVMSVPSADQGFVRGLDSGESFIVAIASPSAPTLSPDPETVTSHVNTNQSFTVGETFGIQDVDVTVTNTSGNMTLHTTESGLSCSNSQTALSLSSASTFWARYCQVGEITITVQDAANTANGTTYTVNIGSPPALLALEDLDGTGLSFDVAALIEAGGADIVYAAGSYTASGTLVAGGLFLGDSNLAPITRIRHRNTAQTGPGGDTITLNDSSALELGPYFDTGVGSDLTMYVQTTPDNVVSWTVASSFERGGGNYAHFQVPSEHRSLVAGISSGERFIFALGRSAVPAFDSDSATRAVDENALINTEVGVPVTAVDPQSATLTYSISGDSAFSINSATGQILTAVATLDYEEATSHVVTVTATSSGGSDTIMVTININDLDDGLRLSPDPEGQHWHVGDEQQFTSGNTPGVESVRVMQMSLTGHLTLRSQSGGTSCASSVNILNLASDASFWALFCTAGTVTLRMEDLADDTNYREWTVTITEVSASAPALMFVVYVDDEGDGYVDLSWPLVGDGGSPITHYEYSSDGGTTWRSTGSTDRSYRATQTSAATPADLENGTAYEFRVRAVNAIGAGAASPAVSATPQAPTVPDAPTGLTATGGNNQVVLSWTEPSDNDSPITHYEFSRDDGATWHSTGSTALTYTDTDVTNGVEYDYQVRAVNVLGEGEASTTVDETPFGPPTAPRDLQGVPGDGSVTLSWTAPENDGGGAGITGYEYKVDSNGYVATGSTSLSHEVTGLTNGQEYAFRVRAQSNFGGGFPAGPESFTPTSNTVPGVPTNPTATPGDEFVDLDWTAPADDGGTPITRYEWTTTHPFGGFSAADGWEDTGSLETNFRATRKTNDAEDVFVNGTEYCFSVRAVNSEGPGDGPLTFCATPANQPPAFVSPAVFRSVDENLLAGANVGNPITASDPEGNTIAYSITGSNPGGFTVNSSGQIQTGQVLNREETVSYTITLRADATGGHDTTEVTIQVADVNEAPVFGQDSYSRSVDENVSTGTHLGSPITADDPDDANLLYTLSGTGASIFNVTITGQIETAGTINYEQASSYTLTLTASDGPLSDTATINITVNNLPEDASLTGLDVPSSGITRTTARIAATLDNQDGTTTTVCFRYRTPPGSGSWTSAGCDSTTGASLEVVLSGLAPGAQYRVQASLSSSFPSSGRQQADFTTASNSGPMFSSAALTLRIDEGALHGASVGDPVTATDDDADTLTYTLSGTNAGAFDIGGSTGQITVGSGTVLDYETKTSYSVTVTATDTHNATGSVAVTIEVNDIREAGLLGSIVITVGRSGSDYGYDSGQYGSLDSGQFPGALFTDGNARSVAEVYEDSNGRWVFAYSGGASNGWLTDQEQLDEITIDVTYEDGRDGRSFVLGGFVDDRPGSRGLRLDPPLPSRDWDEWQGDDVRLDFRRHRTQATMMAPLAIAQASATPGSWVAFLQDSTPGDDVLAQAMITLLVYALWAWKGMRTVQSMVIGGIVMVLTPWVPFVFNMGSPVLAVIVFVNVLLAAYVYKYFFEAREQYT